MENQVEKLLIKRINKNAKLPERKSTGAAGYDLFSCEDCVVPSKGKYIVKTGITLAIPKNSYGRVAPRSGLTVKNFIDVGAGVIDSDYRGELGVILFNFSDVDFQIKAGDRIAQLIIEKITPTEIIEIKENEELDITERGSGGFGSTGK